MIALNESNEYAAEVAFNLPLDSDPLTGLTGHTFTLGEVQIKLPGQTWANASLSKIVEKGYGRFAVRLIAAQTATAGDVFVRAVVTGTQAYYGSDVIGNLGGDIPIANVGSIPFYLPDENDPYNNPPLTLHSFTTGQVRLCLPNGSYADADVSAVEEIGYGGYRLNLSTTQTILPGKAFIYVNVPGYQRFEGYVTILGTGVSGGIVGDSPDPIPVNTTTTVTTGAYKNLITAAVDRLCEYSKSGSFTADEFVDSVGFDLELEEGLA